LKHDCYLVRIIPSLVRPSPLHLNWAGTNRFAASFGAYALVFGASWRKWQRQR
jgi:hypothetical protein